MRLTFVAGFVVLIALASAPASFAGVYKIVGPDGKITYSDKPPADAATTEKMDVIRAPTESIVPPASTTAPSAASTLRGAKQANPSPAATASPARVSDAAGTLDSITEKAVVGVLGYKDLVKQTENLCTETLPTSMRRYSQAAETWQLRNAELVAKAQAALSRTSSTQRNQINATIQAYNANQLSAVVKAPAASKITWCDSSLDTIKSGGMDIRNKAQFVEPLAKY